MSDEVDYSALPLSDRLVHKVWKVRQQAYEEVVKTFEGSRSENDPCFNEYSNKPDLVKKFVTDSNVVAQESGIKVMMKLLEYGGTPAIAVKLRSGGVITALCEKSLSSARKNTKEFAIETLLQIVEVTSNVDGVIEDVLSFSGNRLPKLVAGCVNALTAIVENFGCNVVSPKLIVPVLPKLFGHADRNVRAEATKLTVEIYKWVGGALNSLLMPELKPVQQKDLAAAFETLEGVKPEQKRLTKVQKVELERQQNENAEGEQGLNIIDVDMDGGEEMHAQFDPYEMAEPIEIMSKLPENIESRCSASVWKERKEVLEELYAVLEKVVKLEPRDDYSGLIRIFAKCMKDANLQVVQLAANSAEIIIKGLNKNAQRYVSSLLAPFIERLKEKKPAVATALLSALGAMFKCTSLSFILADAINGMKHKTPQVKIASTNYLQKCLSETRVAPTSVEVDRIMETGVKLLSESQEPIRQAATEMIGTLMKVTGEREVASFLDKIDDNRMTKVKDFYNKVEVKSKFGSAKGDSQINKSSLSKNSGVSSSTTSNDKRPNSSSLLKAPRSSLNPPSIPAKRTAASPAKRMDESQKVGSFSRSLTGRSLATNTNVPAPTSKPAPVSSISAAEKEELASLRKEKISWETQRAKDIQLSSQLKEENFALNQEVNDLRVQKETIMKDQTNSLLMIRQKETQISRLNSDLENAKLKMRDLEQTIEMMKLQQNQIQNSQNFSSHYSSGIGPMLDGNKLSQSPEKQNSRITSGELSSRVDRLSIDGETLKETLVTTNGIGSYTHSTSPIKVSDNKHLYGIPSHQAQEESGSTDDSWRRAAEVTSQLKARIEKMKARSRGLN